MILAGRDAYLATANYFLNLQQVNAEAFALTVLINAGTFEDEESVEKARRELQTRQIPVYSFGQMGSSQSGRDIIKVLGGDGDVSTLGLAGRIKFNQLMHEINGLPL